MTATAITFVLLPGLHGTEALFKRFILAKPDNVIVKTINYPTDKLCSYFQLQQIIEQEIKNIQTPIVLVGESFSGPLSIRVANSMAKSPVSVILVATFVDAPNVKLAKYSPWILIFTVANWVFRPLIAMLNLFSESRFSPIMIEVRKNKPMVLADRIRSVYSVDVVDEFKRCPAPILYLRGKRDVVVPKRNLKQLKKIRPDMREAYFDTTHDILQAEPEVAWQEILIFLKELTCDNNA